MNDLFKSKRIVFKICIVTIVIGLFFTTKTWAIDIEADLSNDYQEWSSLTEDEKEVTIMPNPIQVDAPDSILSEYEVLEKTNLVGSINSTIEAGLTETGSSSDSRYSLADKLSLRIEDQGTTNECWAFSVLKSLETNIALKSGTTELKDFSERHMDYSSVKTFTDGTNSKALDREAGDGGLPIIGLAYLTNGSGAVLEEDLPFEDNGDKISLDDLNKNVDTIVTDYSMLPTLNKTYTKDSSGNTVSVKYTNSDGDEYSTDEINAIRKIIKEHIEENGAVVSFTAGSKSKYYNGSTIFGSTAYNCNDTTVTRDHAITIVGWDDNYSRDNFKDGTKPSTDGAYIVLNSYGEDNFDNGYMYISYEDYFIESELYGICASSNVDYTNIYQYDDFGGILKLKTNSQNAGYIGNTYDRTTTDTEILNNVGFSLADYAKVEIYVNPNGTNMDSSELICIGKSDELLEPGYHRLDVTETELTGSSFAIVIKQIAADDENFTFKIEVSVDGTAYANVTSQNRSFISVNGTDWTNLKNLNVSSVDMENADVCIKAFTTTKKVENGYISSDIYKIDNSYVMNISYETTKEKLQNNIDTNLELKVLDSSENEISDSDLIKTGDKIKLSNDVEYTLIVRGDVNCDGKITLTDVSKIVLYYNGNRGYELTGAAQKSADMNLDTKFTLTDVSQLVELYNSII